MKRLTLLLAVSLLASACIKIPSSDQPDPAKRFANLFACNIMDDYYLWSEEIADGIKSWSFSADPVEKVKQLRYKDAQGNEVDRWTELMEDCSPFLSTVTGNGQTFGFEFILYYLDASHEQLGAVVTYTYEGSPSRKAGLMRGDVITTIDGQKITGDNYYDMLSEKIYDYATTVTLGLADGRSVKMTAETMYSNPIHIAKTLESNGLRIGYLHFTNFTQEAVVDLEDTFRQFKADGIEELILDLRYNTGGYATTGTVLASMIAPLSVVKEGAVYNKSLYNKNLSSFLDEDECFAEEFTFTFSDGTKKTVHPGEVNPGIRRLWVITTGHSASASEALICGLKPYMNVTLVGSNTYGKFCGGFLIQASDWFDAVKDTESLDVEAGKKYTEKWGLYVIASRYSDCNGVTLSMPSGIPADYEAKDAPSDGYALGDPAESMLATVLSLAGGYFAAPTRVSQDGAVEVPFEKTGSYNLLW